ncbi:MAG: ankyrin repeat domain-containing protein [Candidatus Dependentiae bacterium]|nr:ankyrin repeat domain-containing protein [Candidatus Dependentiae bacterium]
MNRKLFVISLIVNVTFSSFLFGMQENSEMLRLTDDCAFDCYFGYKEKIAQAVHDDPNVVHAVDYRGKTLLAIAARAGHVDIVDFLLKREADINAVDNDGCSVLMYAAANPQGLATVKCLIDKGADLTIKHPKKQKMVHEIAVSKVTQTTSPGLIAIAQVLEQVYKKQHEPE